MKRYAESLPEPEKIRAYLAETPHPVRLDNIMRGLNLSRRCKKDLLERLEKLAESGKILRLDAGRWTDAGRARTITGILSVQRSGAGFVVPSSHAGTRRTPDLFIPSRFLGGAWHGDTVEATLIPGTGRAPGQNPEGRILHIVRRGTTELAVCPLDDPRVFRTEIRRHGGFRPQGLLCRPTDPRYPVLFDADIKALPHPPAQGERIIVTPLEELSPGIWSAKATALLGAPDTVCAQEQLVRLNHEIPLDFPPDAAIQAEELAANPPRLPEAETKSFGGAERADLRHLCFVTIDGPDARDFDDAICVEETEGKTILWAAIADVSLYVRPRTGIDREAYARGNSCYFPASVAPMLPEILSNNLCSLKPNEDRPVMAVRIICAADGSVSGFSFAPGLIRSRARLTYEAVQAFFNGSPSPDITDETAAMLRLAAPLAQKMIALRAQRGALDLDLPEAEFLLNNEGRVSGIRKRERLFSHRLIEAFMIAANEAAAHFLTAKNIPFPLRAHPAPDPEKLNTLCRILSETALADKVPSSLPDAAALKRLLNAAEDTPQAQLTARLVLRSMMQARYIPGPAEPAEALHFGLASTAYCHFTSPIRRYADLMVHRALKLALGVPDSVPVPARQKLLAACEQCSTRERAAQNAEREITRRLACLLLQPRTGEVFCGTVSGATQFGFFVEPEDFPVDGMVKLDALTNDWYTFDEKHQCLIGERTGLRIMLGQTMRVRLLSVNMDRLEIDFVPESGEMERLRRNSPPESRRPSFRGRSQKQRRSDKKHSSGSGGAQHKMHSCRTHHAGSKQGGFRRRKPSAYAE